MNKILSAITYVSAFLLLFIAIVSCSGSGSNSAGGGAMGLLGIGLTDAPPHNSYQAVWVTITELRVNHETSGWRTLDGQDLNLPQTIDLLELTNGARAELGVVELAPGHYNQMRLIVSDNENDNWVIDSEGHEIFLKVPGGGNTGIKLVNGFDINSSDSTDLLLDFDVHNSVHPAGNSEKWVLKPTIKAVEIDNSVSGTVDSGQDDADVWVTAQSYNPDADLVKDEVMEEAGVFSLGDGSYFMYLPINITDSPYNIVATKEGFETECHELESTASDEYTVDFTFIPADTGILSGSIINLPIPVDEETYSVHLRIRQFVDCDGFGDEDAMIDVESHNFPNEEGLPISYGPFTLPVGEYEIVAWWVRDDGATDSRGPFEVTLGVDDDIIADDIDFEPPL